MHHLDDLKQVFLLEFLKPLRQLFHIKLFMGISKGGGEVYLGYGKRSYCSLAPALLLGPLLAIVLALITFRNAILLWSAIRTRDRPRSSQRLQ